MAELEVTVPEASGPGELLSITAPNGRTFEVAVPDGCAAGDVFSVQLPQEEDVVRDHEERTMRAQELFDQFDANRNGTLDLSELRELLVAMMREGEREASEADVERLVEAAFKEIDTDSDARISFEEFVVYHNRILDGLGDPAAAEAGADADAKPASVLPSLPFRPSSFSPIYMPVSETPVHIAALGYPMSSSAQQFEKPCCYHPEAFCSR